MTIEIEVSSREDAAEACRIVADQIDKGYTSGTVGWSCDTWSINNLNEED